MEDFKDETDKDETGEEEEDEGEYIEVQVLQRLLHTMFETRGEELGPEETLQGEDPSPRDGNGRGDARSEVV